MISVSSLIKNIVIFLILYISLEEFFLKWLPVSDSIFEGLHLISDLLIIVIIGLYLCISNFKFKLSILNISLILFLSISILSLFMSNAALFGYFAKIWVLLRYLILFYILLKIQISNQDLITFYKFLALTLSIQLVIGLLLLLDVPLINNFFEAREGATKIIVPEDTIKGTFKFGIFYGYFIFVSFIIIFPYVRKILNKIALASITFLFLYLSGSRLVVIGFFAYLGFIAYRKNKLFTVLASVAFFGIFSFISFNSDVGNIGSLVGLFTSDFWIASYQSGRLGIFSIVPMFFESGLKEILIGYSYDTDAITAFLFQNYSNLSAILQNNPIIGIEDVYWIAFTYYYGLIGLAVFGIFYINLMVRAQKLSNVSTSIVHKTAIQSILFLMFFSLLSGFVNQVFYIKTFSFYFWVFTALAMHHVNFNK